MAGKKKQNNTGNTTPEIIERMKAFQTNQDWIYLVQIMEENVKFLEEQILSGRSLEPGSEGKKLTNEEVDRLRDKRDVQRDLMKLPVNIINQLTQYDTPPEEFDPFPQDKKDLRAMTREDEESRKQEAG